MITPEILAEQILAFSRGETPLRDLVAWAEDAIVRFSESDQRPANADAVWDILLYLGAADSPGFPLTQAAIQDMLERLGYPGQNVTT